jgi:hypothetical protein
MNASTRSSCVNGRHAVSSSPSSMFLTWNSPGQGDQTRTDFRPPVSLASSTANRHARRASALACFRATIGHCSPRMSPNACIDASDCRTMRSPARCMTAMTLTLASLLACGGERPCRLSAHRGMVQARLPGVNGPETIAATVVMPLQWGGGRCA